MLSNQARVLVVDGDSEISAALREVLDHESYHVDTAKTCMDALSTLEQAGCDAILLDLEDEESARIELMQRARQICPEVSVIVVTRYPTPASAIAAVRHRAHDYLVKPLKPSDLKHSVTQGIAKARCARRERQLVAGLKELIRLLGYEESASMIHGTSPAPNNGASGVNGHGNLQVRDFIIDRHRRRVRQNGKWVDLTPTEFALLTYLVSHAGEVQGYRKLVREVQGYEADEWEARNLIKYYIHCLRKKLEPHPAEPTYIVNVRGVGYLFTSSNAQFTSVQSAL